MSAEANQLSYLIGKMPGNPDRAAAAILSDTELLDALATHRAIQRLAENAADDGPTDRWRRASVAARKSEHHWPADCLAEAADIIDSTRECLKAIQSLAQSWATQDTDYDEDTEQQIQDGWTLITLLEDPNPDSTPLDQWSGRGQTAMTEWREAGNASREGR